MLENPENRKFRWGGKRPGSGRKMGSTFVDPEWRRLRISCRLPKYVVDWLHAQPLSLATLIENALQSYEIPKPKPHRK